LKTPGKPQENPEKRKENPEKRKENPKKTPRKPEKTRENQKKRKPPPLRLTVPTVTRSPWSPVDRSMLCSLALALAWCANYRLTGMYDPYPDPCSMRQWIDCGGGGGAAMNEHQLV